MQQHSRVRIAAGHFGETDGSQNQTPGDETPRHFATEDTPTQFSRNDSLSDLSNFEEENDTNLPEAIKPISNSGT